MSVVNENEIEIVGGAIVVNWKLQTISADEACVVVETFNTQKYCEVNVNDVDEVVFMFQVTVRFCTRVCFACACVIQWYMCIYVTECPTN